MKIMVRGMDGTNLIVQSNSTDTLAQLKEAITTKLGITLNEDIIFFYFELK